MYFLLNMGIFQLAMLVYQSVFQLRFETLRSELSQSFLALLFLGEKKNISWNLEACFFGQLSSKEYANHPCWDQFFLGREKHNILYLCKSFLKVEGSFGIEIVFEIGTSIAQKLPSGNEGFPLPYVYVVFVAVFNFSENS